MSRKNKINVFRTITFWGITLAPTFYGLEYEYSLKIYNYKI